MYVGLEVLSLGFDPEAWRGIARKRALGRWVGHLPGAVPALKQLAEEVGGRPPYDVVVECLGVEVVPPSDLKNTAPYPAPPPWLRAIQRGRETELMGEVDGWLSQGEHLLAWNTLRQVVEMRLAQGWTHTEAVDKALEIAEISGWTTISEAIRCLGPRPDETPPTWDDVTERQEEVAQLGVELLFHGTPSQKSEAVSFFIKHPDVRLPGNKGLTDVLRDPELPEPARAQLVQHLLGTWTSGNLWLKIAMRVEVTTAGRASAVLTAMLEHDGDWIRANADAIVAANPDVAGRIPT
jgi:hypothetical protein